MSEQVPLVHGMSAADEYGQHPIPAHWRKPFADIVVAFIEGDFTLERGVAGVDRIPEETAAQIEEYLSDYGATLVPLPEETWKTSVCAWSGQDWAALVDLWTVEEGRSDLVIDARVTQDATGVAIRVHLVYVP